MYTQDIPLSTMWDLSWVGLVCLCPVVSGVYSGTHRSQYETQACLYQPCDLVQGT